MSQTQINDMLKRMLSFGSTEQSPLPTPVEHTENPKSPQTIELAFPESASEEQKHDKIRTESKPIFSVSRKQKRENERKEKRIMNAKIKKNVHIEKPTLSQLKEIVRKNEFDKDDRARIERVLYNN